MEWIKNCDRIVHKKLVNKKVYRVKVEGGHETNARFWVYAGGEEVAFILPDSSAELSVTHFFA